MRKGLLTASLLGCGLLFSVVGCGGGNEPTPSTHTYTIEITNKAELQAEWPLSAGGRSINLTITKDGVEQNATSEISKGNLTFTVADSTVAKVQGRTVSPLKVGSTTVTAKYGDKSDFFTATISEAEHGTSKDDPFTVAEAVAKCVETGSTETTTDYFTKGVVKSIGSPYSEEYKNITFDIADSSTATSTVKCYRVVKDDAATFDITKIGVGSEVLIKGHLVNYQNNTPEYPAGSKILEATEGHTAQIISSNVADALAAAKKLGENATSQDKYEITGYITAVDPTGARGFYMSDTKGAVEPSKDQFLVFYGNGTIPADATVNAKVKVLDFIKHYKSSTSENYAYETAGQTGPEKYTLLEPGDDPVPPEEGDHMVIVDSPVAGTQYKLGMKVSNRNDTSDLFLTGEKDGNFGATSKKYDEGVKAELVAASEGKYNVKLTYSDSSVKYLNGVVSGNYTNISFDAEAKTAYTYDATAKTLFFEANGHTDSGKDGTYFFGTYGTKTTVGASFISYITGEKAADVDVSQFPIHFCVKGEGPAPAELTGIAVSPKAANVNLYGKTEAQKVNLSVAPVPSNAELPEEILWSSDNEKVTVVKGEVSIPADLVAAGGEAVKVTITASTGEDGFEDTSVITVKNEESAKVVADVIDPAFTGLPTPASGEGASYADWSEKTGESGAIYSGHSAISGDKYGDPVGLLQLRYDLKDAAKRAGIWTIASGGKAVSVVIDCHSKTTDNREFLVFASHTAYSGIADVADDSKAVATLKKTSSELVLTYTFTEEFEFVCVRTKSGAAYLNSVTINWQ